MRIEDVLDTIICGDCSEVMRRLPDKCVDAVVTDPPYNVGLRYDGDATNDAKAEYAEWCQDWFFECLRVASVVALTPGTPNLHTWYDMLEPDILMCNFRPNGAGYSKAGFCHWEPILVYGTPSGARQTDVVRAAIVHDRSAEPHPCPKPIEFGRQLVRMMCRAGGTVLDPFMGSGTTGVACVETGRHYIGIDISEKYCEIARRRIGSARVPLLLGDDVPAASYSAPLGGSE